MSSGEVAYEIVGGRTARGEVTCAGAKNLITKAMVASVLGDTPTTLTNVPEIGDVAITAEMLTSIGVKIRWLDRTTMEIDPRSMDTSSPNIPMPHSGSNRVPILLLGALLQRCETVSVPILGGCNIGSRNVEFHVEALEAFGAGITRSDSGFSARRKGRLTAAHVTLPYPSVGATENCLFLSAMAEGRSVIRNCALEPEIFELITMLRAMGAVVFTSPSREIRIEGVCGLQGTKMRILGDRIEAASWACLACVSDGDILVNGVRPDTMGNFLSHYTLAGGGFELQGYSSIRFFRKGKLRPVMIETDVYPGFSTDWQQPFAVLLTQADGISIIHETVYENRFGFLRALDAFGAKTQLTTACLGGLHCRFRDTKHEHSAILMGPTPLKSADQIAIPDLRAGLAYVIAAAVAEGTTRITGIHYLERGYGDVEAKLRALGLSVKRVTLDPVPSAQCSESAIG